MSMIDKYGIFVAKSNDNEYLYQDQSGDLGRILFRYYSPKDAQSAIERAGHTNQCHVVELIEAPAKVVVSEEEDKMLKKAKNTTVWRPAAVISKYAYNAAKDSDQEALLEDRLMRAYVNGWTVEKHKRWNVKVPHTNCGWYFKCEDDENENPPIIDELGCDSAGDPKNWDDSSYFTAAEIEHYGLQDCERVEVTDDDD